MAPDAIERSVLVVDTTDGEFLVSPSSPNQGVRAVCCGLRPPLFADFFDDRFFIQLPLKRKRFGRLVKYIIARVRAWSSRLSIDGVQLA